MNKITFSHTYNKMPPGSLKGTRILEVFTTTKKDLSDDFIKFDTEIKTFQDPISEYIEPKKYYPLPDGKLIVILLLTGNHLWQTVRRATPEKEKYYRSLRGQEVEIVIEETGWIKV